MMTQQQTFDILHIARSYVAAGLSIMPIARGTKEPATNLLPRVYDEAAGKTHPSWRIYQERRPTDDELLRWYASSDAGVAIICGQVSGGLVVLDLESPALYDRWRTHLLDILDNQILADLPVATTGKGYHVYFRMAEPIGNRKLAMEERQVLAETRGQGGYVVAPPSVHPSGTIYTLHSGNFCAIPLLDEGQVLALLDAARALAPAVEHPAGASTGSAGDIIGAFTRPARSSRSLRRPATSRSGQGATSGQTASVAAS